jgi:hypothetical protein
VFHRSEAVVVPEVGVNVGLRLTPWLQAEVGSSFLYWSRVLRLDGAIGRVVDQAQVSTSQLCF